MTDKPYNTSFKNLTDLEGHVGQELGLSEWTLITQKRINTFAQATDDHQWIHIDPEKSEKHSPYKKTIAHGFLVLSLASKFAYETYSIDDVAVGLNYGLDKVRFPNATPSGAQLRGRISLMSYDTIPGGARFKLKVTFEIRNEKKPACVAEFIAQAYTSSK